MKKLLVVLTLIGTLTLATTQSSQAAHESARSKSTGIGFVLGDPSGFSFQFDSSIDHSINAGIAWSWDHWTQIWVDYAFHFPHFISDLIKEPTFMDAYIGIGGGLILADSSRYRTTAGGLIRIPLGVEYKLATAPFGFFFEIAPGMIFGPVTQGNVDFGIGARFYF